MKTSGLFTLGRDAEARTLQSGEVVVNLALASNYGKKGADGKRPTQWVDGSFWGERASKLAQYLLKGHQVVAYISDIHIETYEGRNGAGSKLVGRVDDIELVARQDRDQQQAPARQAAPQQARQSAPPPRPASGFDDMDDDIPF